MATERRACRAGELEAVAALASRVFRNGGGDMAADYPLMFTDENREGLWIAVDDGRPMALVGVCIRDAILLGARLRVASIGAVCTDPERRGQGHASALMEDARCYARERGASLMLISGGRGLYHRLGYVTVGRFDCYQWDAGQIDGRHDSEFSVAGYRDEDLPDIGRLYQREPIRFLRSVADWQNLLRAGKLMNRPAELLVVRRADQVVAYLGVQTPAAPRPSLVPHARLYEIGGSRAAIVGALAALRDRYGAPNITLITQPGDTEMTNLALERGWVPQSVPFPGTLGVIDPERLITALQPVLRERDDTELTVTTAGNEVTLTAGSEQHMLSASGSLEALLFAGDTEEARAVPPCGGLLGRLFGRLFPIPLPWQGYNYV